MIKYLKNSWVPNLQNENEPLHELLIKYKFSLKNLGINLIIFSPDSKLIVFKSLN